MFSPYRPASSLRSRVLVLFFSLGAVASLGCGHTFARVTDAHPLQPMLLVEHVAASDSLEREKLHIEWIDIPRDIVLAIALQSGSSAFDAKPIHASREDFVPGTIVARAIDAGSGSDTLFIDPIWLRIEHPEPRIIINCWGLDALQIVRMCGSEFVQGNLRPCGELSVRPDDLTKKFCFLRALDRTLYLPELTDRPTILAGDPDSLSYRLSIPGTSVTVSALDTLVVKSAHK